MDIAFADSFDLYANANPDLPGSLATMWTIIDPNNQFDLNIHMVTGIKGTGKAVRMEGNFSNTELRRNFDTTKKISFAFGFKPVRWRPDVNQILCTFYDPALAQQFAIHMTPANKLQLIGEGGLVVATGARTYNLGIIYRMMLNVDLTNDGAGVILLKANGNIDLDGVYDINDAASTDMAYVGFTGSTKFFASSTSAIYDIDDTFMVINECTDLNGVECILLPATTDIDKGWTPLTGTDNFAMVDDVPTDADTTYNSTVTVGARDIFTVPDLAREPDVIHCVSLVTVARKEESATRTIRNVLKSGAVTALGADYGLSETYTHDYDHYHLDPNGDVPWTKARVDGVTSGYEAAEIA